jgi:molecular chaperone GrpE
MTTEKEILDETQNEAGVETDKKADNAEQKSEKTEKPSKKSSRLKKKSKEDILSEELIEAKEKMAEINDKYLRLYSEFDNFRKRTMKEKAELYKTAGEDVIINIISIVDDFERALKATDDSEENKAHKEGLSLIFNKFKRVLEQKGVKEMEATGTDFDTDLHEALTKIPAPTADLKGKVVDVIEKGYTMNEKVIRFAKVVVGE